MENTKIHDDCSALGELLYPYMVSGEYKNSCLRLRCIEIEYDKDGHPLIAFTDMIDAIWDTAYAGRSRTGLLHH